MARNSVFYKSRTGHPERFRDDPLKRNHNELFAMATERYQPQQARANQQDCRRLRNDNNVTECGANDKVIHKCVAL